MKGTRSRPDGVPPAVAACHELIGWMIPTLDKVPRVRRFTLGDRIETGLLDVLERLIEATYTRRNATVLNQANLRIDVVRHLWRLAYELNVISGRQYGYGAEQMEGLGRQIGGWRRAAPSRGQTQTQSHAVSRAQAASDGSENQP